MHLFTYGHMFMSDTLHASMKPAMSTGLEFEKKEERSASLMGSAHGPNKWDVLTKCVIKSHLVPS